jgi:stearoyl-CoA desaturase (delta-9 desaturase)
MTQADIAANPADRPLALPPAVDRRRKLWPYVVGLAGVHALAAAALIPWLFTWSGLALLLVGIPLFGQGINFCYHRLLTHRSLAVPKWLEHFWVVVAICNLEDTPAKWVTVHRHHHNHSDEDADPHSPLVNFIWSHFQWITLHNDQTRTRAALAHYARDILADRFYFNLERQPWLAPAIYLAHLLAFFAAGAAVGGWVGGSVGDAARLGLSWLVWAGLLRTVAVWHITWSVNSVTHLWGYRNHQTNDGSRNNILVGLLAAGEGWHNNHHHDPASACNQHRWWELDPTWYHIRLLQALGLAKKVIRPRHQRHAQRQTPTTPNPAKT